MILPLKILKGFIVKRFTLLFLIPLNLYAVNLGQEVENLIRENNIPALSVMILENGKVINHTFRGVRKMGSDELVTASDVYHLGSCAKAFTAALVFKLIENKKLSLSDKAIKYLSSDISNHKEYSDITIGDLLSHTAGIDQNIMGKTWEKLWTFDISPKEGRELATNYFLSSKRSAKAGEKYSYSNLGYVLLGKIIEQIESETFEVALKKNLFTPLNMTSCVFGPVGRDGKTAGPWPHETKEKKHIPVDPTKIEGDNPPTYHSAGGISCTPRDWAKFVSSVQGVGDQKDFFTQQTRLQMTKVNKDDYTYGAWGRVQKDWAQGDVLTHSGSNTLNFSFVVAGLNKKFIFLINSNSGSRKALDLVPKLIQMVP